MSNNQYPNRSINHQQQSYSFSPTVEDSNIPTSIARPYTTTIQDPFSDSISPLTPNNDSSSSHSPISPHEMTGLYNNGGIDSPSRPRYFNNNNNEIEFQGNNSNYSLTIGEKDEISSSNDYGEGKYGSDEEFRPLHEQQQQQQSDNNNDGIGGFYSPNEGNSFYKNEAPE